MREGGSRTLEICAFQPSGMHSSMAARHHHRRSSVRGPLGRGGENTQLAHGDAKPPPPGLGMRTPLQRHRGAVSSPLMPMALSTTHEHIPPSLGTPQAAAERAHMAGEVVELDWPGAPRWREGSAREPQPEVRKSGGTAACRWHSRGGRRQECPLSGKSVERIRQRTKAAQFSSHRTDRRTHGLYRRSGNRPLDIVSPLRSFHFFLPVALGPGAFPGECVRGCPCPHLVFSAAGRLESKPGRRRQAPEPKCPARPNGSAATYQISLPGGHPRAAMAPEKCQALVMRPADTNHQHDVQHQYVSSPWRMPGDVKTTPPLLHSPARYARASHSSVEDSTHPHRRGLGRVSAGPQGGAKG